MMMASRRRALGFATALAVAACGGHLVSSGSAPGGGSTTDGAGPAQPAPNSPTFVVMAPPGPLDASGGPSRCRHGHRRRQRLAGDPGPHVPEHHRPVDHACGSSPPHACESLSKRHHGYGGIETFQWSATCDAGTPVIADPSSISTIFTCGAALTDCAVRLTVGLDGIGPDGGDLGPLCTDPAPSTAAGSFIASGSARLQFARTVGPSAGGACRIARILSNGSGPHGFCGICGVQCTGETPFCVAGTCVAAPCDGGNADDAGVCVSADQ